MDRMATLQELARFAATLHGQRAVTAYHGRWRHDPMAQLQLRDRRMGARPAGWEPGADDFDVSFLRGLTHARDLMRANGELAVVFDELFALRRREPADDVISTIVATEGTPWCRTRWSRSACCC